jgi:UDP-N-acetylmuramate--alanine ligase
MPWRQWRWLVNQLPSAPLPRFQDFGGVQRCSNRTMPADHGGRRLRPPPAEIKATLAAARSGWDRAADRGFQPHCYTRTRALFDDFVTAFYQADRSW